MDSGIYEIVNLANGKRYIGSAVRLGMRCREHRSRLVTGKHRNRVLQNAWTKYGADCFQFNVLLRCPTEDLIGHEQRFIDTIAPEYNLCPTAGSSLGRVPSAETRAKIAAKLRGRKHTTPRGEEWRAKLAAAHRGKPKTAASIEKMRATKRGKKLAPEHAAKLAAILRQVTPREKSPEHRARISAALKGVAHSAERRAKQAAAQTGLKRGPYKRTKPHHLALNTNI